MNKDKISQLFEKFEYCYSAEEEIKILAELGYELI